MTPTVIRRPARVRVELATAPSIAPRIEVPKLTAAEERDRMMRSRDRRIRGEVIAEFRAVGARVDLGDPIKGARGEYRFTEGT